MAETIRKKMMAVILTLTMMIIFIPVMTLTASAAEDVTPSTNLFGSGTAAVPFEIASAADLAYMRNQINTSGGTITPSGGGDSVTANTAHYRLTADIVLGYWQDDGDGIVEAGEIYDSASGTAYSASNWTPIGTYYKSDSVDNYPFKGTFDGDGHTVSGIYTNYELYSQGLFGYVNGGTIKNVGVINSYIKGDKQVGSVVGMNDSGTIENSYNTGSVSGSRSVGGVVGNSWSGTLKYCYNIGNVSGTTDNVGGVVGSNQQKYGGTQPTVQYCYNSGSVSGRYYVGGVAGWNAGGGTIENSYNTGSVSGENYVGGVVGYNGPGSTVRGCYYDKQMCTVGGIGGVDSGGSAEGKLTLEMTSGVAFTGWSSGETGTWNFTTGLYPRLTGYVDASADYKMDETDAAYVSASPVFLATSDTATTVKYNFTLSTENGVSWSSSDGSIISIVGNNAMLEGNGSTTLTASLRGVTKSITLTVDLTPPILQNAVRDNDTQITVTLSEPCLNLAKANDGGFTVTKRGTEETFAVSQTAQGADSSQVVLTVADMAMAGVKGVTVTYTAGANGTITDIAGNLLSTDSTGVVIPPWAPKLGTPVGLLWDTANPAKATWGAVANASSYTVQLYKDDIASGDPLTGITNTYYDLSAVITETGTYTFTVQAIGDGATYSDSDVSSKSPEYSYTYPIKTAFVNITAPAAGAAPQTADQVETATSNTDYTVTSIVWHGALTAGDKFKAGQVYTATVTLTSKNGKEFQAAPFTPTVASASSVGTTTTAGMGIGNTVTFTVTFSATEAQSVAAVAVKTQPTKLNYTEGELLNLAGLVFTLTYNDGSSADIPYDQFDANGITANPSQGTEMEIAAHNGQAVTLTCNTHTATTGNLTVSVAPTYAITLSETGTHTFTALTVAYTPVAPITVTVTKTGTGNITNLSAALSGTDADKFTLGALDATTLDSTTTSATFTVKPNDALAPGTYLATVTVTADNSVSQSFNICFTVNAPSAPIIQSAAAGDTHINITWSSVPEATGYKIYQSTISGSYGAELATVSDSVYNYDAAGLSNGTTYFFIVRASIGIYDSVNSNEVSSTPQVPAPGAPVLQTAVAGDGHVNLTWSEVKGSIGYKIYSSTVSGTYTSPVDTVAGSVYSCDVTGLTNGTAYYFVITASNPGGDSGYSNEISAIPQVSAPSAPTGLTATGENGKVILSWNSTAEAAGYKIYQSEVSGSYGTALTTVAESVYSYEITGLTNGVIYYFVIKATNAGGDSPYSAEVTASPHRPSNGGSDDSNTPSTPASPAQPANPGVEILVNGKTEIAATATTTQEGDKTVTSVVVDDKKVEKRLEQEGNNVFLTIPVNNGADVVIGTLNGQTVKNMENMEAILEIKTENVTYTIPASQINIDAVSAQFGEQIELKDIAVSVKISEPAAETIRIVEDTANKNNYQIMVKPIEFEITCSRGDKTVEVSKFNAYVERLIEIPEGIDPSKITTGIILNADGTFSHVPTVITVIDGKYYAKINSLTNSVYSIIYSPKTFKDVEKHWAKEAVNDMASRLVVSGVGEERFEPDRDITRAEFAAIAVRALGLMRLGTGKASFNDIAKNDWYYDAVSIAYENDIISGYGNGKFGPDDKITREQAMTMIARAMKITGLNVEIKDSEVSSLLANYTDGVAASAYAKTSIAACLKTGVITGRIGSAIAPRDYITRAEVAVIVQRLLQKSNLI